MAVRVVVAGELDMNLRTIDLDTTHLVSVVGASWPDAGGRMRVSGLAFLISGMEDTRDAIDWAVDQWNLKAPRGFAPLHTTGMCMKDAQFMDHTIVQVPVPPPEKPKREPRFKFGFGFAQYGFMLGAYWDSGERALHIMPLPMLGIRIRF